MNFVHECTTTSAPKSRGFCKIGDQKVLSTATKILCFFAISTQYLISIIVRVGFVGV